MKSIKVTILGADGYTCQIPRIKEAMQNLGHTLSEESPDLIFFTKITGAFIFITGFIKGSV